MQAPVNTSMEIVTFIVAAFLQLAALDLEGLRETVKAIETALAHECVEIAASSSPRVRGPEAVHQKEKGPAM